MAVGGPFVPMASFCSRKGSGQDVQGQIRGGLTSCRHKRSALVRCTFYKALGGICQTAVWRPTTGCGIFGQTYPQNSHQQPPAAGGWRGQGAFWLQRLPPARTQAEHGAYATGVHTSLCTAHPTQRFCAHQALRLFEQYGQRQAPARIAPPFASTCSRRGSSTKHAPALSMLQKKASSSPSKASTPVAHPPGLWAGPKKLSLCDRLAAWVRAAMPCCEQNRPFEAPTRPLNKKQPNRLPSKYLKSHRKTHRGRPEYGSFNTSFMLGASRRTKA